MQQATLLPDGRSVRLRCTGLRESYVHQLSVPGVRSAAGAPVVNATAYYTLNRLPGVENQAKAVVAIAAAFLGA